MKKLMLALSGVLLFSLIACDGDGEGRISKQEKEKQRASLFIESLGHECRSVTTLFPKERLGKHSSLQRVVCSNGETYFIKRDKIFSQRFHYVCYKGICRRVD